MAWDKDKPAGNRKIRLSDEEIRANWAALETQIAQDHSFGTGLTGEHKHLKFFAPIATPGNLANKGFVYTKDVTAKIQLHWEDEDGNELALTHGAGIINDFPTGTKLPFYQDVAPTGWTIQNALNDKLLFVTKGSVAGGETGGGAHSTGTWTQPSHTLVEGEIPTIAVPGWRSTYVVQLAASSWNLTNKLSAGIAVGGGANFNLTISTGGGAHNHGGTTYRPAAYNVIIASKN